MAGKTNIRSIRFSDELAELIDRQAGDTFTAKFEALITRCVYELPQKEAELERLQSQIDERRQELIRRIAHPALPSIQDRPETAALRREPGHWEMDLVVSKKGGSHALMTLTDRFSRRELIFKLPDKRAASVRAVFDKLEKNLPDFYQRFRSITTDNGSEFLEYDKLVESIHGGKRFEVYYCHAYSAWEKGTNENHNRMIRRWYPKGTDFRRIPMRQVADLEQWMNNYPRKSLGWKTPLEMAV